MTRTNDSVVFEGRVQAVQFLVGYLLMLVLSVVVIFFVMLGTSKANRALFLALVIADVAALLLSLPATLRLRALRQGANRESVPRGRALFVEAFRVARG